LPYVTGGVAFGTLKTTDSASVFSGTLLESTSDTTTRTGWTVGGGLEYAFADAWSARVEYLYVNLGKFDTAIPCLALCIDAVDVVVHHKYSDSIVRAALNYRFGGW
jgi:outer membrane immunogenic protein